MHAVCLDVSETGCRATWPDRIPRVGDAVNLTWDVGDRLPGTVEVGWVAARVVRVIAQASGAVQVCFDFETTTLAQVARIRACHQAWLQRHQQRLRGDAAA